MRHYRKFIPLLLLAVLLGAPLPGMAQVTGDCDQSIGEATLDINNVRARILNNGNLFWRGDPHVYEVPKGGGVNAIFASGIWVGGLIDGQLHLAGSTYGPYEFWPGPLDDNGNPPDDCNAFDRIYKVSKEDVVAFEGSGIASNDLLEWPTGLGAPTFYEVDTDTGLTRVDIVLQPDGSLDHIVKRDDGTEEVLQTEALSFEERKARLINLGAGERPAILGDQMLWWVMNDRGNVHGRTNGLPIGLEVHGTVFAFNTAGAIGNTTFYKYRFFYKGDVPLTQTYMGIFVDPDLGNFDDDYVGSDTTLGLGFVYNADNDDEGGYGANPPALGYDFFQGPLVNDDGIDNDEDGEVDEADERLQMTSFVFYNNGGCSDTCDPSTAEEYYNYMRALWKDGVPITFGGDGRNFSQIPTKFMFPGDPESGAFWSELNSDGANTAIAPADRRFVMSTGPFTIKPGDEQEIVFGIVWSRGANNLNSVTKLKEDDALAQAVFDIDFELPAPPAAPRVKATPLDSRVILEWSYLPTDNNYLESYRVIDPLLSPDVQDRDYVFEGYNVFRFDSPQDQEGELIAVYDVPNGITRVIEGTGLTFLTADGTDSGIQHHHIIDGLTNYQTYFFGVQAYAYNAESGQKVYAGPIRRVEVVPTRIEARNGGTVLAEEALTKAFQANAEADIVAAKDGKGGGSVTVDVVNPAEVTGHSYRVEFYEVCDEAGKQGTVSFAKTGEDDAPRSGDVAAKAAAACVTTYDVIDETTGEKKFDGAQAVAVTGKGAPQGQNVLLIDGLSFSIAGPEPAPLLLDPNVDDSYAWVEIFGVKPDGTVIDACGPEAGSTFGCDIVGGNNVWHSLNSTADYFLSTASSAPGPEERIGLFAPNDFEIRFTAEGSYAYHPFTTGNAIWVPFEVWDIGPTGPFGENDPSDDVQLIPNLFSDNGGECEFDMAEVAEEAAFGFPASDRIYAYYPTTTYADWEAAVKPLVDADPNGCPNAFDATGGAIEDHIDFGRDRPLQRIVVADFAGDGTPPLPGTVIRFLTTKPNLPGDVFTFSTEGMGAVFGDPATAKAMLEQIGITPNPYKGASAYEVNQLNDQVRFTNMPEQATIRVFSLNGTLIRVMRKNSPDAFFTWDLTTEEGLPIASGMYLIHVEVPGVGEKVIKFAAIKKRIQLNTF